MQPIPTTHYYVMQPLTADSVSHLNQGVVEAYEIYSPTDFSTVNKTTDCSDVYLQIVNPKEFAGKRIQARHCLPCQGPVRQFDNVQEHLDFFQEAVRQASMITNLALAFERGENDWGC